MNTKQVFLATGSNLGNRKANLLKAQQLINKQVGVVEKTSHVYETQAWGLREQADFLNQVLEVRTTLKPQEVLTTAKQIEQAMGREQGAKWGKRLIDIDILFYEQEIVDTEQLTIPHPFLEQRNFVLIPLCEIAPAFQHPVFKQSIAELLSNSKDHLSVKILDE